MRAASAGVRILRLRRGAERETPRKEEDGPIERRSPPSDALENSRSAQALRRRPGRAPDLAAFVMSVVIAIAVFLRIREVGLIGWDSLPEIASSRIQSLSDFFQTFSERTAEGYYLFKFYRPMLNLSLAFDYALWGLDPLGYQLSSAALFGACGFALYRLTRGLLHAGACSPGPWIALAVFFVAPFNLDVVAFVSRRMDMLAALFMCLALTSQLRRCKDEMPRSAWGPALFTLGAIGSKEIAVILPPLVFLLVLVYGRQVAAGLPWRRASLAAVPHVAAVTLCIVARLAAFGDLGGHPTTRLTGAVDLLPQMLGSVLVGQLASASSGIDATPLTIGIAALVAAAILWGRLLLRSKALEEDACGSAFGAIAVALAWLIGSAGVLGMVGMLQSWYLFIPGVGFAIGVGAVAQLLFDAVGARGVVIRVAASAAFVAIVFLTGRQAMSAPLLREPQHLIEATKLADEYLANLRARIDSAPNASIVGNPTAPAMVRLDDDPAAPLTTLLTWYSIQAWADLVYHDRELVVLPRSPAAPPVIVRQTTTVVELHPRFANLAPMSSGSSYAVQRPSGSDPRSIKESMKQVRKRINRFKNAKRSQR